MNLLTCTLITTTMLFSADSIAIDEPTGAHKAQGMYDTEQFVLSAQEADRQHAAMIFASYLGCLKLAGPDDTTTNWLRKKLTNDTAHAALITEIDVPSLHSKLGLHAMDPDAQLTRILLAVWQRIDTEVDQHPPPTEPVVRNVAPPFESGMPSGADPTSIQDPELRAVYEESIRRNSERALKLRESIAIKQTHERFVLEASIQLRHAARRMSHDSRQHLIERIEELELRNAEKLLSKLREIDPSG